MTVSEVIVSVLIGAVSVSSTGLRINTPNTTSNIFHRTGTQTCHNARLTRDTMR